jgi:hypothetical protein
MPRTVIPLTNPIFKVADTEAGLTTGDAYECQLTSAAITASANFQTIPPTGCAPAAQSPGATSWALDLAWLQDWTAVGGGLSNYAYENDAQAVWFSLALDSVNAPTVVATGQAYVTAGSFGGTFGDGSPAAATATWPCLDKPTIVSAVAAAAAAGTERDTEPEPAVA